MSDALSYTPVGLRRLVRSDLIRLITGCLSGLDLAPSSPRAPSDSGFGDSGLALP